MMMLIVVSSVSLLQDCFFLDELRLSLPSFSVVISKSLSACGFATGENCGRQGTSWLDSPGFPM